MWYGQGVAKASGWNISHMRKGWKSSLAWRREGWSGTGGLHQCAQIPQSRGQRKWIHALLSVCPVTGEETMHGHKLKLRMFPLNMMENIFCCVMPEHWLRLFKEVVMCPSLEILKSHLDWSWANVLCGPAWAEGWIRSAPKVPSNLSNSLGPRRITRHWPKVQSQ